MDIKNIRQVIIVDQKGNKHVLQFSKGSELQYVQEQGTKTKTVKNGFVEHAPSGYVHTVIEVHSFVKPNKKRKKKSRQKKS